MKNSWTVIKKPIVTEKSYALAEKNIYTFIVDKDANKNEIKNAVEEAFSVKVAAVNTAVFKGKTKMMKNMVLEGKRKDWKKAYITLKEGHRLNIM
ncbi:MAG: 50S ribosomal protein L23 [Planctomycetes bacterium RBG_16_43_13]|nr:MAG: 50S ribosomal protein L23 [Planctomycetes bacterium RBG_16_43_13]